MLSIDDINLTNLRVLIREDLNVPIEDKKVTSDARILAVIPTLKKVLAKGARVMVMSHMGRPTEGQINPNGDAHSLEPVVNELSKHLGQNVRFIKEWIDKPVDVAPGEIVLLENTRYLVGENACDEQLSKKMASLCDVFVMDAFAVSHRAQASTVGVAKFAKISVAGPLLMAEIQALEKVMAKPERPLVAIVGGSKVSTKLDVLKSLINIVDTLVVGGGIANTFIAAHGYEVGKSLYEPDLVALAQELLALANEKGVKIVIPMDVTVATSMSKDAITTIKSIDDISADEGIFDIGPQTQAVLESVMASAKTILWNGPVGVFEMSNFEAGTKALSMAIANSPAFTVAGGGDTLAAIDKYNIKSKISQISTGGGAFLEFVEGKVLPGVAVLQNGSKG